MSDPYFHYKGNVTLENDAHRYSMPFELWEERQGELITPSGGDPWYLPTHRSWCGVAVLPGAVPEGLRDMAWQGDGQVRVILPDGRTGRAVIVSTDDDDDAFVIEIMGVGEPPS